jgi:hypothetical protein
MPTFCAAGHKSTFQKLTSFWGFLMKHIGIVCLGLWATAGFLAPSADAASHAIAVTAQNGVRSDEDSTVRRTSEQSMLISPFSATSPTEIGVAGLVFGMTKQQVVARLVAANVSYTLEDPRNLTFRIKEPINNLSIEVRVSFLETDSLSGIVLSHQAPSANVLHERWFAGLAQQYGAPTLATNRDDISNSVFCHTPAISISLGKNSNKQVTPVPIVFLSYGGPLGLGRNLKLCELAPQSRAFPLAVFPLPNTMNTSSMAANNPNAAVLRPAPVGAPDLAAAERADLATIASALSLILEARPFGDRYVPGSAKTTRTGLSDDKAATVIAGSYRYYMEGSSREAVSNFYARFENAKLKCVRMEQGVFELAPCLSVPANAEAAKQARVQAERSNPKVMAPPAQSRSWAADKCKTTSTECLEREYARVYESIPADVLTGARSPFQKTPPKSNYRDILDAIVSIDSRQWSINEYIKGSMRDVSKKENGEFTDVSGYYGLADNLWVTVRFRDSRMVCIKYWDTDSCSPAFVNKYSSVPALSDAAIAEQIRLEAINGPIRRYNACLDAANKMPDDGFKDRALFSCKTIRPN